MNTIAIPRCRPQLRPLTPFGAKYSISKPPLHASRLVVKAEKDFDQVLVEFANKFETADNKTAIIGWGIGAISAFIVAEWLMHLPLFNILIGFPVQLLGLAVTPFLVIRYWVEKTSDPISDLEMVVDKVTGQLPGLKD